MNILFASCRQIYPDKRAYLLHKSFRCRDLTWLFLLRKFRLRRQIQRDIYGQRRVSVLPLPECEVSRLRCFGIFSIQLLSLPVKFAFAEKRQIQNQGKPPKGQPTKGQPPKGQPTDFIASFNASLIVLFSDSYSKITDPVNLFLICIFTFFMVTVLRGRFWFRVFRCG